MVCKKIKQFFMILAAGVMLCGCLILSGRTMQANAAEGIKAAEEDYTEDLQFLTYCDMDALRVWDDSIAVLTDAEAKEMKQYIETNIISNAENDYEKASLIFDWIVDNVVYAWDMNVMLSANPYYVFQNKIAVCGGYSNLYKAMLNLVNIPAVVVTGDTPAGGHAWNALYADDRWFYADSTWGASYGGGFFDEGIAHFSKEHTTTRLEAVSIETADGLLIGYDQGISVIGVNPGVTTVNVPETFEEFKITSVSYKLFSYAYNVKTLNLSKNVTAIDTQVTSAVLESITVDEENPMYASKDGVLFTKDYNDILIYPKEKKDDTFVLPKETTGFDEKETFTNIYLKNLEVEEGNSKYTSYDGALYNSDQTELLVVSAGKKEVRILDSASISDLAFANSDTSALTIYAKSDSPAHQYAVANHINFVSVSDVTPTPDVTETPEVTPTETPEIAPTETPKVTPTETPEVTPTETPEIVPTETPEITPSETPAESVTELFEDVYEDWYTRYVQYVYDNDLMKGIEGTAEFRPDQEITRAQVAQVIYNMEGRPEATDRSACTELKDVYDDWYTDAVCWAYANDIVTGHLDTMTFKPEDFVTREQLALMLCRYAEYKEYAVNQTSDLTGLLGAGEVSDWALTGVKWAVGAELIGGIEIKDENGTVTGLDLAPQGNASRAQMAAILMRFCELNAE